MRIMVAGVFAMVVAASATQAQIKEERVHFAPGASSARVNGTLHGDLTIDYRLGAKAGQTMVVEFKPANPMAYFNVLPPGSAGEAIFIGSSAGNRFEGKLPADGDYTLRVYLIRAAARRGETSAYTLDVSIRSAGAAAAPALDPKAADAISRAGAGRFDATSEIPCAQNKGQPTTRCKTGVARAGGGTATVVVTLPDGRKRMIFFEKGAPTGSDSSQADGAGALTGRKESDLHFIRIGDERYEIPDAVIFGG
ncbi:MAG: hypothetical protein IPK81_15415 [Rhodospirillales bacterium]|nr:MAG: hypothetical protein IPK81_15415 [Rhodospirillales bacterium]